MTATPTQARDEVASLWKSAWEAAFPSYPILWDDAPTDIPDGVAGWSRFTMRHVNGGATSAAGTEGTQRYERLGVVTVQMFATMADGLTIADQMLEEGLKAFEGQRTSSGVLLRNVRAREVGADGPWYQINIIADFEYVQIH